MDWRICWLPVLAVVLQAPGVEGGTNAAGKDFLEANKDRPGVVTLSSGLQYKVLRKGKGKFHPTEDSPCSCHYAGTTLALTPDAVDRREEDWTEFDSSYKRGEPSEFAPNQVIKGWTEAMQLMVEGDKWEMYIPSELGYGDSGSGQKIKGGDMLIFRMEVMQIKGGRTKKVHACNVKVQDDCEPYEVELLDLWGKKSVADIEKGVKSFKNKAKYENNQKKREELAAKMKLLTEIAKSKKSEGEL